MKSGERSWNGLLGDSYWLVKGRFCLGVGRLSRILGATAIFVCLSTCKNFSGKSRVRQDSYVE